MNNIPEFVPPSVRQVSDVLIFKTIWGIYQHKSFVSGLWLRSFAGTPLFMNCFMRILDTKDYPCFSHALKNIIPCTPGELGLYVGGTEEERIQYALDLEEKSRGTSTAKWNVIKSMAEELKSDYKQLFPSTRGIMINYKYSLKEQGVILGKYNRQFLDNLHK